MCANALRLSGGFGDGSFGLRLRTIESVRDRVSGIGRNSLRLALGCFERLGCFELCASNNPLGVDVGLADDPGGLLFGDAQHCFEASAKTRIGGSFGFATGCLECGQAFGGNFELFESALPVLRGLDQLRAEFADDSVDFAALVAAKFGLELGVFDCHYVRSPNRCR